MKICADAGGTNIRFAYVDKMHKVLVKKKYPISSFRGIETGFSAALNKFIDETKELGFSQESIDAIVVSASGYVKNDQVQFTNTDWIISIDQISNNFSSAFSLDIDIFLLNDFEALAYGVSTIEDEDVINIFSREGSGDTKIVCGPGTRFRTCSNKRSWS